MRTLLSHASALTEGLHANSQCVGSALGGESAHRSLLHWQERVHTRECTSTANLFDPLCNTGNQACGGVSQEFGWFNPTAQETRPAAEFPMSLGLFEQLCNTGNLACGGVRGGSTLPNLLEPLCVTSLGWFNPTEPPQATVLQREQGLLCYRGNMLEFAVAQRFRTCLNHCSTQGIGPVGEFLMSSGWFPTEPPRTTVLQRKQGL